MKQSAYGLQLSAEFDLPYLVESISTDFSVKIRRSGPESRFEVGEQIFSEELADGRTAVSILELRGSEISVGRRFSYLSGQTFDVIRLKTGSIEIVDQTAESVEPALRIATLYGPILSWASYLSGRIPIHSSVVLFPSTDSLRLDSSRTDSLQAFGFLAHRGAGKSTIASYLVTQPSLGYLPWCDDVASLSFSDERNYWRVAPGPQQFRLWRDSASQLHPENVQPLYTGTSKVGASWHSDFRPSIDPKLSAFFLLDPQPVDSVTIQPMSPVQGLKTLVEQSRVYDWLDSTSKSEHLQQISQIAANIPLYKLGARVGLDRLEEVATVLQNFTRNW